MMLDLGSILLFEESKIFSDFVGLNNYIFQASVSFQS